MQNQIWNESEHKRASHLRDMIMTSVVERQSEHENRYWEEYFSKLDALE